MSTQSTEHPTVLIVDDNPNIRDIYNQWVSRTEPTATASTRNETLDVLEKHETIEVVLLDRHMPGCSGDEILTEIHDRGYDCKVAMVTAVSPTFDILDMPFDDYLTKPTNENELNRLIAGLRSRHKYSETLDSYYRTIAKIETLRAEYPDCDLAENDQYQELRDSASTLQKQLDENTHAATHTDFKIALSDLNIPSISK